MVRFLAVIAIIVLLAPGTFFRDPPIKSESTQFIVAEPLVFNLEDTSRRRVGSLVFEAGWVLSSDNADFGGISALIVQPGNRILAVSDANILIGFTLTDEGLAERSFIAPLPSRTRETLPKEDRDSESVAADPATGRFWVGYEHHHAIRRYGRGFARLEAVAKPAAMQNWPSNGGAEAMVRLADGRFVVFSEAAEGPEGSKQILLFAGDPAEPDTSTRTFGYRPPAGYRPTDAAQLPDGRILMLNRRFSVFEGISAKITILEPDFSRENSVWVGETIATLAPPFAVDNMEGLAITQDRGQTHVWLASDDNFLVFQRTLLMKFRLDLPAAQ